MKKQRLPRGLAEKQIRELAAYHDSLPEEQQAAEIERGLKEEDGTLVLVPTELVPDILKLISKERTA